MPSRLWLELQIWKNKRFQSFLKQCSKSLITFMYVRGYSTRGLGQSKYVHLYLIQFICQVYWALLLWTTVYFETFVTPSRHTCFGKVSQTQNQETTYRLKFRKTEFMSFSGCMRNTVCEQTQYTMAESSVSLAQDQFSCSICLNLLKDPVTIPCGHSYCMSCITGYWDQKRVYSCPQCRQTFTPRPVLGKNTMLAEVLEKLKKTKLQAACPAQCYSGSGDVECDVCTGRLYKAIKSCLTCLNSYCQNHLEQHETFFKGKRHNLMDVTGRLQEMICSQHEKLLEIYCQKDQCCICVQCMLNEHKNHYTLGLAEERIKKQVWSKSRQSFSKFLPFASLLKKMYLDGTWESTQNFVSFAV